VILFSDYLNLCDHNPPTLQTGKRTDEQTTFSQKYRATHQRASSVKIV